MFSIKLYLYAINEIENENKSPKFMLSGFFRKQRLFQTVHCRLENYVSNWTLLYDKNWC